MPPTPPSPDPPTEPGREGASTGAGFVRGLPTGRALLGGVLITCAALGLFVSTRPGGRLPTTRYYVARHHLGLGHRVTAGDLVAVPIALPATVAATARDGAVPATGTVVVRPIAKGALVQRADLAASKRAHAEPVVSFAIEASRAVAGDLAEGDRVDVFDPPDDPEGAQETSRVGHDLVVVAVHRPGQDSIGASDKMTLSVSVPSDAALSTLVGALGSDHLVVVRTSGVGR